MAVPTKKATGHHMSDPDSQAMIFEGASVSQLAKIFGMDNRTVGSKIIAIDPIGTRKTYPVYSIKDAAQVLLEPTLDLDQVEKIAAYVRKLNPTNMPKMLTKEFWAAMRQKQAWEEDAAELWRTDKVVEVFSELVKSIRDPLILAKDAVASQRELDDRTQQIIDGIIDGILEKLHDAVVEQFGKRAPAPTVDDDDF